MDSQRGTPCCSRVTEFTQSAHLSVARGERGKASVTGVLPGGWAMPRSSPVYWPQKVTLSGRLAPPAPFIPSRAHWALSSVVRLFSENCWGEVGSDSEPGVEKRGIKGEKGMCHRAQGVSQSQTEAQLRFES